MTRHRVLIDIEFTVDEDRFKLAQLTSDDTGVSDVTDATIREAITRLLIRADWGDYMTPLRSLVTIRPLTPDGYYEDIYIPTEPGTL